MISTASVSFFLSLSTFQFMSFWTFLNTLQILIYVRITQIYIPPKLNAMLASFRSTIGYSNIFTYFINSNEYDVPQEAFYQFGFKTTSLLLNIGHLIGAFFLIVFNMIIVHLLLCLFRKIELKYTFIIEICEKYAKTFRYNAFLRYVIQFYLDYAIAAIVGVLSISFESFQHLYNFSLCILIILFTAITPIQALCFINSNKEKIKAHELQLNSKYGSLFYEFSNDHGLFS